MYETRANASTLRAAVSHQVEFEHRRLKPGALPPSLAAPRERMRALLTRARLTRGVFVVLGAAAIAFFTQRAGIGLEGALCLFLFALPALWVGGWLLGFLFSARRAARKVAEAVGSSAWQGELAAATMLEKVKLSADAPGLEVTRAEGTQLVRWSSVRIERVGPETLAVSLGAEELALNESLMVPRAAFPSAEAFDEFCLTLQRFVWEAQR